MKTSTLIIGAFGATLLSISAFAQDQAGGEIKLPEACQKAVQMPGIMGHMGDMGMGSMMENMLQHMGGEMSEATRAYMQVMTAMHQPMMEGAMAQDPDFAFNCSMIAHHLAPLPWPASSFSTGRTKHPAR